MARGRRRGAVRGKSASPKKRCGSDTDLSQIISDNEDRADVSPSSVLLRKRRSSGNNTKLEPAAKVLRTTRQSARRSRLPVSGKDFDSESVVDSPSLSCKDNNVCDSEVAQTDECYNLTENDKSSVLEDIKNVEYEDQNEQKQNTSRSIHWSDIPLQESESEIHNVKATTVGASYGSSCPESGTTKTADETVKEDNNAEGADQALDNPNTLLDIKSFNIKESESDDAMEVSEPSIMDSKKLKSVNIGIDEESTSPVEIDESKSQNIVTSVVDKTTAKRVPGIIELDKLKPVGSGTGDMPDTPAKLAENEPQSSENVTTNKVSDEGEACIEESEGLKPAEESFDKKYDDVIIIRDFEDDDDEYEGDDLLYDDDDVEIQSSDSELENELILEESDTLSEADNDTQPEVDEQDQDIKTSTCSDKSDSSHITGLSFIIGIKGKPASADGKAVQPSFDCVLCNEDFISYTGAAMHSHVTTRSHILNVMKLYSYSMYKQYESDMNIATEKMHSILAGYEKAKGKQHLTMACAEAHAKIRKDVHVHIENIRNKSGDEKDSSQNIKENIPLGDYEKTKDKQHLTMASAEAHANIRKDVQVDIENIKNKSDEADSKNQDVSEKFPSGTKYSLFKEWYKKEIKELAKLQAYTPPNFISLVVDTRDKNVVLEPKGENPSMKLQQQFKGCDVIQIAENDLEASYDVIEKHSSFDKGTVYVLLGGNYSFMKKVQLPDCKKNCCENTIYELLQVGVLPIEQALSLHKKILKNTKNDTVIFATMYPVTYESFKFHAYNERDCKNIHSIQPPSIESSEAENYNRLISNYNEFVRSHTEEMGFFPWLMDKQSLTLSKNSSCPNTKDGFNFSELVCKARKYQIRVNAGRLRQILKAKSSQLSPCNRQQPDMGYNPEIAVMNNFMNFVTAFQGYCSSTSQPDHPGGSVVYNNPILPPNTDNSVSSAVTAQYVDTTQVACVARNPDKGNNFPHSVFADEYNIATLDLYSQNFISALSDIMTVLNNQTVFKKVLFVGKGSLIRPLSKINVESDLVVHSLEKVTRQTVLSVLKKICPISPDTVCCLVFDMDVITEDVAACCCKTCKFEIPVQFTVIKSLIDKRISQCLNHIQNFVQGLSHHVPVIGLPLYPTTLHCFDGQFANHELMHSVIKYGCIVRDASQLLHKNIQALTDFWNDLLRETHKHFPSAALVARFIDEQITMLPIIERVVDVTSHRAEPAIWMLLTEFIILSLVSPKSKSSSYDMPVSDIRPRGVTGPVPLSKSKSSSYDMPVSNIRSGGVTGPVPQMSINVEPLRNMSATKDSAAVMNVLHVSDSIPKEFFSEFITAVDPKASILDKRYPDNYAVSFMKRSTAELVAYKLQDCQIGDTTLQVKIVGNKVEIPALNKAQFADITSLFDRVYLKWKSHIYYNIAKKLSNVMDITSFKTTECPGNCEGFDRCVYYHNYSDKRRNPVMFNYSQLLCSRARDSVGMCFLGETCDSSHNTYEQLFHPTIFQTVPCPSNNTQKECDQKSVCKFAHIDTPEMFFTSSWEDLLVFGTQNTLSYFAGAIRGLKKIASTHTDYKVVLISPSREFLDVAKKGVAGVIADYGVSVATIGEDIIGQDCQVFLSVPASLENYQIQIFNDRVGGALIVDNVKKLLGNIDDSCVFLKFINQVQLVSSGSAIVNKVFVSSHYDADVSGSLLRNFGLKLKEVKDQVDRKKSNEGSVRTSAASRINNSGYESTISELLQRKYDIQRDQLSTSQHFEYNSVQSWKTGSASEVQPLRTGSNTGVQSWTTGSDTKVQSCRTGSNTKLQSEDRNVQVDSRVTTSDSSELRLKFGPHLYEEYMKAERALRHTIDEEYKVYQEVSELHPHYKVYYEDFMSKYSTTHHNKGEIHKETLWIRYWKVKFEDIKKQDYEQQKETLIQEYETKATCKTFSNEPSNSEKKWVGPEKFSVEGTLNLLEQICNNMGMLGAAILAMVTSSRELGITTKAALDIFTDSENIKLLKMVLEKLETSKLSAPRDMVGIYHKTIEWTVQLIEVTKTKANIDLNGIARASVGKDLNFIVNMIKSALFYQGITAPSKEEVNELYLKVCSLHFGMASEG